MAIAKRLREECDYDEHKRATEEETQTAITDAEGFVRETQKLLRQLLARQGK